jgi:Pyruvate:ferredoxin oxidoreductase and related 2-oxoacid:ferredoxin oxidoreductases, alpha subunit
MQFGRGLPHVPRHRSIGFFARNAERFGAVVEQVEDELAAVNMAIGASYAGARSLVSTSGGGFALM